MTDRLFGRPHSEVFYPTIADVWETEIEGSGPEDGLAFTVEEWTVIDPSAHLPSVHLVTEYIVEMAGDDQGLEGSYDAFEQAAKRQEPQALLASALAVIAKGVAYHQADTKVAEHTISVVDGEPYLNGEPLYQKRGAI